MGKGPSKGSKGDKKGGGGRRSGPVTWKAFALLLSAAAVLALLVLLIPEERLERPAPPRPPAVSVPVPPPDIKAIAIIIDDIGHSRRAAEPFIQSPHPVALAFLPGRPHTGELAEDAYRKGKTILLHLPMQPKGYPGIDPGEGAVLLDHSRGEAEKVLLSDLESVPHAAGLNNHMGSLATEDETVMRTVLDLAKDRGLFFIDSRTTADSVGYRMAQMMDIPALERDVFLDNDRTSDALNGRADELLDLAEERGWAVGIGHAYPETARALDRIAREARARGILWLPLEEIIAYAGSRN